MQVYAKRQPYFITLAYRNYDPILGRMNGVDPMASKYSSLTPYNYSFNNPVTFTDPNGADPYNHYSGGSGYYFSGGYYTYDDVARNPDNMGEFHSAFGWRDSYSMGFLASAMGYGRMSSWQGSTFFAGIPMPVGAQRQRIMNGVTEALTNKDGGIWDVNPITGKATQLWSESKFLEQLELQKYFGIDPNSLTTCNEPNCKHGVAKSGVVNTAVGTATAVAGELYYSEKAGTWMGKNFKIYEQTWGGNGPTGGKLKFGKKVSTGFKIGGYGLGILSAYDIRQQNKVGEITDRQKYIEQASNLFTTIGGIYGASWGVGWEIGRGITKTEWYQEMKFNLFYDYWESKVGPPSRSNEELWIYFFKNYKP